MYFLNRTAVVTGAAGRIGRAVAQAFARYGVKLYLADVNMERLEALAEELRRDHPEIHYQFGIHHISRLVHESGLQIAFDSKSSPEAFRQSRYNIRPGNSSSEEHSRYT